MTDQQTAYRPILTADSCAPAARITKSLLGYGIVAGPVYVITSLVQAATRDGFNASRHEWSLLANGTLGWIQITNLVLTGLMTVCAAFGLRRAMADQRARWPFRALAAYGIGMVLAGAFRADPSDGFPPGTPTGISHDVSWHGALHLVTAGVGFAGLVVACLTAARWFARTHQPRWAAYSRVTGWLFLAAFAGIAAGAGHPVANLAFTVAVILGCAWVSAISLHLYRTIPDATC
jgi:hypothetical protein